jgi:hypothetical protein
MGKTLNAIGPPFFGTGFAKNASAADPIGPIDSMARLLAVGVAVLGSTSIPIGGNEHVALRHSEGARLRVSFANAASGFQRNHPWPWPQTPIDNTSIGVNGRAETTPRRGAS